jgi:pyruvate,water dikinase
MIFAGGASLFGYQVTHTSQGVIWIAGERLWGDMTPVLRNSAGRRLAPRFLGVIEPSIVPVLHELMAQPPLNQATGRPRLDTFRRLAKFIRPMLKRILANWLHPENQAKQMQNESQQEIAQLQARGAEITAGENALKQSLALYRQLYNAFVYAVPHFGPGLAAGLAPLALLNRLSQHLEVDPGKALEVTRGLPNNVTTQMDLDLWETARKIRSEGIALAQMQNSPAVELADEYLNRNLPPVAQEAVTDFLKRYGMRGVGEIDIGRPRWSEDPTQIMQVIKSYLRIEDDSQAPDAVFQHGIQAAERAIDELEAAARQGLLGPLRAKMVRAASRRVRALAGLRESPKFYIIQMMGIIRKNLLECGEELVASGLLEQPDDLFYLYLTELEALAAGENRDWSGLVAEHRNRYRREYLRRQAPRLLLSDGRAFYEGIRTTDADSNTLVGSPVSPGVVEGRVRVVLEPHNAQLEPGEILVCPATDPAWTPLFLAARGLVMEVGGMMTHGAIVAREYGIPAVVGVHAVTRRLHTGQHIRVDGSNGKVIIIQE